ncbi:spermatid nuclear transition protein 3-like [Bubalus kerabau]|uniref:spermatid nuclear transition protein 3-like n=1 Tax=Bubalus carabanensis TaxID=3119969 RepID=UPI00244EE7C6|nr:spermatid nuclear transition protein 3-like [Bubalus carabanensis]
MTKVTRKPRQSRRVTMWFASRMNGQKKTLCQRRYRGSVKARNMTMRVRRPLQGTLRKKIRSYATQSKKVKKPRKPNCFFRSCAHKKLNQSHKRYQNMRRDQRRRQDPKRR